MKIGIVGLGLIGGSLGLKLQSLNHTIYGIANNELNKKKAKEKKLANFVSCDMILLKECELIILALPFFLFLILLYDYPRTQFLQSQHQLVLFPEVLMLLIVETD